MQLGSVACLLSAIDGGGLPLWRSVLDISVFGVLGMVLLVFGYYVWELITPYNNRQELQENKNLAVAIVVAAFVLGMAIVIAAAIMRVG
jgi:putative membrane protein